MPASLCCRRRAGPNWEPAANSHLLTDGFAGYRSRDADLGEYLKHTPVIQDDSANAGEFLPIIHTLFGNIKAWLVGTHHGVSAKPPTTSSQLVPCRPAPPVSTALPQQSGNLL